ncbi:MAG: PQQ-dependent sugar dehydrogenase [Caldilineaceae bacterium]|nr:PQQ-dependent sugar dehydrogenase [Caldilineaceae bacterium]
MRQPPWSAIHWRVGVWLSGVLLLLMACDGAIRVPTAQVTAEPTTAAIPAPTASATTSFQPEGITITLETVVEELSAPLFVTHAGDGSMRLFVVEKAGTIRIVRDGILSERPFLDITDRIRSSGGEQGLLGLAFAPTYPDNGFFFVNYTDSNGDTVVARYTAAPANADQADPASEFIVLQLEQPAANHNGGMLAFGTDGYLYIGTGDGGGSGDRYGNGQNPDSLLGKMLRLDVLSDPAQPYTIPADNPWVTADWQGNDVRDEIWAMGLRNPWRYSFDRVTGDLWIGDVGQNQWEEIHYTPAGSHTGLNYGWPIMEASHCYNSNRCDQSGLLLPVTEYDHRGHCSVTGGYVYRGAAFSAIQGVYLFGDYCSGTLWATWFGSNGQWQTAELLDSDNSISSFGEDEAGELYITDLARGELRRVLVAE